LYDPTLLKYRPRTIGKNATEISVPELFDRYTQHRIKAKTKRLSQSSIETRYKPMTRMLEKHLNIPAKVSSPKWSEVVRSGHIIEIAPTSEGEGYFDRWTVDSSADRSKTN
jgi:hypothetical protein